jgi:hypothetical protein
MSKMSLKRRALRDPALAAELKKHEEAEQEASKTQQDNPMALLYNLHHVERVHMCATSRKGRAQQLMSRRSASSWDAAKKAKMVRRLMRANQEVQQSETAIAQLTHRLEQVG